MSAPSTDQFRAAVAAALPGIRADLEDLVRIPSVSRDGATSPDVARSAETVATLLADLGMPDVRVLEADDGAPAVVARIPGPEGAPTVLLYAHHDVQPAGNLADWDSDPFEPVEREGRLYGRGAADDKAGIMAHVGALRVLQAAYPDGLPVGVTVFVEGEEEVGSPTFGPFLEEYGELLAADVIVIADSSNWEVDVPAFTTSLRGLVEVFVEVRTHAGEQHSGVFGGLFPDALTSLCRLLAGLHDDEGRVAVPGVGARAGPDRGPGRGRAACRGRGPRGRGLDRRGFGGQPDLVAACGDGARDRRPPHGGCGERAAPHRPGEGQHADRSGAGPGCLPSRRWQITSSASAPWGVSVTCVPGAAGNAVALVPSGPNADVARAAFTDAWDGAEPVHMGIGGSIPFIADIAVKFPEATILVVGPGDPAACWHGPNESVDLEVLRRLTLAEVLLLARLGDRV